MRVLVLSVLSSVVEDELSRHAAATGTPQPLVCMPAAAAIERKRTTPSHRYELIAIRSLHSFNDLRNLAAAVEGTIDAVITTNECAVQAAAFMRACLGLPGMDLATAVRFTDKHAMKQSLAAAGIPVAAHEIAYRPDDVLRTRFGFPAVVKHRLGFNSVNTHVLRSPIDLRQLDATGTFSVDGQAPAALQGEVAHVGLASTPMGFIVEEYVPIRDEYHCEILKIDGRVTYAIPGRYSRPCLEENGLGVAGGYLLDPTSAQAQQVRSMAVAAADALGLVEGCAHAEVFHTTDGRWLLGEIAARPGGLGIQPTISHAYAGINLPAILAGFARGETPHVVPVGKPGVFGWAAALSRPALLHSIVDLRDLRDDPRIIDSDILQSVGTIGEPGAMPVAYLQLHTSTTAEMSDTLATAGDLFRVRWSEPVVGAVAA